MSTFRLDPSSLKPTRLVPPLSKSDAQRRLVLEHLLGGTPSPERGDRSARDVRVLAQALETLRLPLGLEPHKVDCADGGAPFRLFLGQAAVTPGAWVSITGTPRLGQRPHRPLLDALLETLGPVGLELEEGDPWPLVVCGASRPAKEPCFQVSGALSSQFVSSLLLAAASLARRESRAWRVVLQDSLTSEGYLALTVDWMRRSGLPVEHHGAGYTVHPPPPGLPSPPRLPPTPGDWSSLGYLLLLAWCSGSEVTDVDLEAAHPDRAVVRILREAGLTLDVQAGNARVTGTPQRGLLASGEECPDLLPTLAVLACALPGPSTLRAVHVLRAKESDRLEGIRSLVAQAGGSVEDAESDSVRIFPPTRPSLGPLEVESQDDHRLAMCGALLSVLQRRPASITHAECVTKSFPGFWDELQRLGVRVER